MTRRRPARPHGPGWPRGLTLIEIVTVLAVLAVLATLALPSLGNLAQRHRLAAAAESLAADLTEARLEAARSGQPLWVRAESAGDNGAVRWCWVVATSPGCGCTDASPTLPACALRRVSAADHAGVELARPLQAGFDPGGTRLGTPGTGAAVAAGASPAAGPAMRAELASRAGDRLQIQLGALGRASICVPAGLPLAGWRYPPC